MVRLDMSEYMERHTVSRLIGAPPGYVGCEEGGQLTEKVRRRPYTLVLFDEIEKAHEDVWNILLQILEDGFVTDAQGRRIDFRSTVIVMTSNVGAKLITSTAPRLGFLSEGDGGAQDGHVRQAVLEELRRTFKPEFLNRIDETILFKRLTRTDTEEIARRMLHAVSERADALGITLTFDAAAVEWLAEKGYDPSYGARPLRRVIRTEVEDALASLLLSGQLRAGESARGILSDGAFQIECAIPMAVEE